MSYRLFSDRKYPFYAITNEDYSNRLRPFFDGIIVLEKYTSTFLDKIYIYENTVFDETIFIDADSNITKNIAPLFTLFENNGSDISVIGKKVDLSENYRGHLYTEKTIKLFGLKQDIQFNGGVYFFRKSESAEKCIRFILDDLVPNYKEYELDLAGGTKMHDEPVFIVGMLCHNMSPVNDHRQFMRPLYVQPDSLVWNVRNREYSFLDYGEQISPAILHWMTNNTHSYKYIKYNSEIKSLYFGYGKARTKAAVIISLIRFGLTERIYPWVQSHFTKEYILFSVNRIRKLRGRGK